MKSAAVRINSSPVSSRSPRVSATSARRTGAGFATLALTGVLTVPLLTPSALASEWSPMAESTPLAEPTSSANPLDQTVSDSEATSSEQVLFNHGHMDMGPRVVDGTWRLQIRDDSAKTPVWRDMDNTVITVKDNAQLKVPSSDKYSFLKEKPGTPVWVLPQTEKQGIAWPGWNTQHPSALKAMTKGVNFTLDKVSGPGDMIMYLENGALEGPQVLWDSHKKDRQNVFAESNTHTHANWVFTKPGIYYAQVTASATTTSGKLVKDTEVLRFAVGSSTDPMGAFTAKPFGADTGDESGSGQSFWSGPWPWVAAGALALLVTLAAVAGTRKRSSAIAAGRAQADHEASEPPSGSVSSTGSTRLDPDAGAR